ncbi:hypothetical protein L6R52_27700 [Myxococcota bacterium]|nr:hypothetical protein [Myxococcota bacterium]
MRDRLRPNPLELRELAQPEYLSSCFGAVRERSAAAGVDGITPAAFAEQLTPRVRELSSALLSGVWAPGRLLHISQAKTDGGVRRLSIATVADRIVIEGLRRLLDPRVEPLLSPLAFAYRRGRSAKDAVRAVVRSVRGGSPWVTLADIREFFDSVPLEPVTRALSELGLSEALGTVVERLLGAHARRPGVGLAQGSAWSPLLSNLALVPLDRRARELGLELVRYSDNLCVTSNTEPAAREALSVLDQTVQQLGLRLKPAASVVRHVRDGFEWLGFHIDLAGVGATRGAVAALIARADAATRGVPSDRHREVILPIARGWLAYFSTLPASEGSLGAHEPVLREIARSLAEQAANTGAAEASDPPTPALGAAEASSADEPTEEDDPWCLPEIASCASEEPNSEDLTEALVREGRYAEAEALLVRSGEAATPKEELATLPEISEAWADDYLGLFCARQDTFEVADLSSTRRADGPRPFVVIPRAPSSMDVVGHILGARALAIRPRLADGTATLAVIDLDPAAGHEHEAHGIATAIASFLRRRGIDVLVEETGGRGLHVWIPLEAPASADLAARAMARVAEASGARSSGAVRVEILPAPDAAPDLHGQTITLPLGRHAETGARSSLRWFGGAEILPSVAADPALKRFVPSATFCALGAEAAADAAPGTEQSVRKTPSGAATGPSILALRWDGHGPLVEKVMGGCAVLKHLALKADSVGHLTHSERLSLLYTLGHLGPRGHDALHSVISRCRDYDADETSRHIARLGAVPIGCARLREKHAEELAAGECPCAVDQGPRARGFATPLLLAMSFKRAWLKELRRRRARDHKGGSVSGVRRLAPAVSAEPSGPRASAPVDLDRVGAERLAPGVPPHEWA